MEFLIHDIEGLSTKYLVGFRIIVLIEISLEVWNIQIFYKEEIFHSSILNIAKEAHKSPSPWRWPKFWSMLFHGVSHSWIKVERPRAIAIHPDSHQISLKPFLHSILTFFYCCFKTISPADIWCPFRGPVFKKVNYYPKIKGFSNWPYPLYCITK